MVKTKCPNIMFVIETKSKRERVERIRKKNGFDRGFVVDSRGCSGGFALLWKSTNQVELVSYISSHISVNVTDDENRKTWLFVSIAIL